MRRIDWTETMLSRLAELYPVETTAHTAYMLQIGVTAVKEKSPRTRTGEAGQEPVAGTCRTYQPPLRQPFLRRDGRRPGRQPHHSQPHGTQAGAEPEQGKGLRDVVPCPQ